MQKRILRINADEQRYLEVLSSRDSQKMKALVSGYDILFIDEAQRVPEIGINLKILHDQFPSLKIIVTGSSSFELANKIKEPLTGRTKTFTMYPLAFKELHAHYNPFELNSLLESVLIYGLYPEVFSLENLKDKQHHLNELASSYLYKDVLDLLNLKHKNKIRHLLQLLAFQIGSEVSLSEIARQLEIGKDTVNSYLDILEKSFIVFRLSGFSRNLRKEVSKKDKVYFFDLGIRNSIIDNFKPIKLRNDSGSMWENFLITERWKKRSYEESHASRYFWRTHTGAELDYVEETEGTLYGFEFKFNTKSPKAPASWLYNYPLSQYTTVNIDNYQSFIL